MIHLQYMVKSLRRVKLRACLKDGFKDKVQGFSDLERSRRTQLQSETSISLSDQFF